MISQWLLIAILAYLFFSFSSLGDKLVLSGLPKPKSYTFYMGVLGLVVLLLIPFVGLSIPDTQTFIWIILNAIVRILAIYTMFVALKRFEVSRVVPTIGATQPIFVFLLSFIFWGAQAIMGSEIFAFALLLLGSVIISTEKNKKANGGYLAITIFSSIMFSLDYIFSKKVFLNINFLHGVIWTGLFVFLFVLLFLIKKDTRKEIFAKNIISDKNTQLTFICTQACGGLANFLQSYAISLAPVASIAIVNSLRGIQYVFLFLITIIISVFNPKVLKEELSLSVVTRKMFAIIIIAVGLAKLVIK